MYSPHPNLTLMQDLPLPPMHSKNLRKIIGLHVYSVGVVFVSTLIFSIMDILPSSLGYAALSAVLVYSSMLSFFNAT